MSKKKNTKFADQWFNLYGSLDEQFGKLGEGMACTGASNWSIPPVLQVGK